jgi:hypothetical protein
LESLQLSAGFPDGVDFRVRRGIVRRGHAIPAAPDDPAAPHDDGTERTTVITPHLFELDADGFTHEFRFHMKSAPAFTPAGNCLPPS